MAKLHMDQFIVSQFRTFKIVFHWQIF